MTDRCCENIPVYEVLYDVGTYGEKTFLVCKICINKKSFSKFIKSLKKVDKIG